MQQKISLPSLSRTLIFLWILLAIAGCKIKIDSNIDAESVNEQIENRKIKRVTDSELVSFASSRAQPIADSLFKTLPLEQDLCSRNGFQVSNPEDAALIDSVLVRCQATPNFTTKEYQVWQAYEYSAKNDLSFEENIQILNEQQILYTKPFKADTETGNGKGFAVLSLYMSRKELIKQF